MFFFGNNDQKQFKQKLTRGVLCDQGLEISGWMVPHNSLQEHQEAEEAMKAIEFFTRLGNRINLTHVTQVGHYTALGSHFIF